MVGMHRDNLVIIIVLTLGIFLVNHFNYQENNTKANIWANHEKEFFKPIDVIWRGKIISTMAGSLCIGLEGDFDNYSQAMACLPNNDSNELWKLEGVVTVTGKWLGITCAYRNTVFGECVPDVAIESIGQ